MYQRRGFHWRDGVFQDIGIPGCKRMIVYDINDQGMVCGLCYEWDSVPTFPSPGFVWKDGVLTPIGDLMPPDACLRRIVATALNNQGQIAGYAERDVSPFIPVGFLLTPQSKVQGDFDCNHVVDVDDLLGVINAWGESGPHPADFNHDQTVDVLDLMIVINSWTF